MLDYVKAYVDPQTLAILAALAAIFLPKIPGVSTLLSKIKWPFGGTAATNPTDNRKALHDALCLLSDRAGQTQCEKLKARQDAAITELSKMVPRLPEYQPPVSEPDTRTIANA